jgi:hypothetical protein
MSGRYAWMPWRWLAKRQIMSNATPAPKHAAAVSSRPAAATHAKERTLSSSASASVPYAQDGQEVSAETAARTSTAKDDVSKGRLVGTGSLLATTAKAASNVDYPKLVIRISKEDPALLWQNLQTSFKYLMNIR